MKKNLSKLFALALALIMAMALAVPAMAATITITNSAKGETYKVYKIFDVTKAEGATAESGYAYKINSSTNEWWDDIVNYIGVDADDSGKYIGKGITLTPTTTANVYNVTVDDKSFDAADFAKELANVMSDKTPVATKTGTGSALDITVDDTGYYFVDTSLGSLCSLLTSDQSVEIVEKNSVPSLKKEVQEDKTSAWGEKATADYGQSVEFKLTVNTGTNSAIAADNKTGVDADYVITDTIPNNMTLDNNAVEGEASYITMPEGWTKDTDYTEQLDGNTLTITLKQAKLATLGENANIEISYSATLNDTATVGAAETNTATLTYKAQSFQDTADVVTYSIGGTTEASTITKVDGEDHALAGVKFILKNETTGKYATFDTESWKLTGWVDVEKNATELVTDGSGHIYAYGLDADTYTLKETYTLPGYNLLNDTITAVIDENGTVTYKYSSAESGAENSIKIVNESGGLLPSTGGMGTTIFYTVGALLVVGAGVLLVTKKRVHDAEK